MNESKIKSFFMKKKQVLSREQLKLLINLQFLLVYYLTILVCVINFVKIVIT